MILPSLIEANAPGYRPIKYALFPPLGLASLASYLDPDYEVELLDEHVQAPLALDDTPDLLVMSVYITSARRAWEIADAYRARGTHVCVGGLHPTSLPDEAALHADTVFIGPGEGAWQEFLADFRAGRPKPRYQADASMRRLEGIPPVRRDLIERRRYLCPNSIVVSRGCPHHCDFCYKDAFYEGGRSFYSQTVDAALAEIERLPGKHLYFLDDHLLGNERFARELFEGMRGMGRLFQGASTVQAILRSDLIERAAEASWRDPRDEPRRWIGHAGEHHVGAEVGMRESLQELGGTALRDPGRAVHDEVLEQAPVVPRGGRHGQRDPRVPTEVPELALIGQRRDDDLVVLETDPRGGDLWTPVLVDRDDLRNRIALEEPTSRVGEDDPRHPPIVRRDG